MRCLQVIPYMDERAGGPVVVVDRLCRELAGRGHEPVVLTTDAYAGSDSADDNLAAPYEMRRHHSLTGRFAYSPALAASLDDMVRKCDLVHVHTLWTFPTAAAIRACRRHGVPCLVMPHGMLDPHSRSRRALKKLIYGRLLEYPRLRSVAGMVYTTREEQRLAEAGVPGLPQGHLVPLGTDEPPESRERLAGGFLSSHPELRGKTLITFLGRVHPKKGLDLLVPAFAKAASLAPDMHLLIVGPDENGFWASLQKQIRLASLEARVTRIDMLRGAPKWEALAASALFALPSYQENFAIAVAEACRIGTPVVVSDRVNTWPTIQAAGAGIVIRCDVDELAAAMRAATANPLEWTRMSEAAVAAAKEHFDWSRSADALLNAYERACEPRRRRLSATAKVAAA